MRQRARSNPRRDRAWWASSRDDAGPSPLLSLRLLGLASPRRDAACTLAIAGLVAMSRIAALPASIWEQDEAYFAGAVHQLDLIANHPHPPWFPLWIALGKLVHLGGIEPARGLQLVSLVFGVWILFPLTALWSRFLRRELALAASVLFLATPVAWLLAGRAFSGTAATALLAAAMAWWLREPIAPRDLAYGAVAATAALLIRPHFALPVLATALWLLLRHRRHAAPLLAPIAGLGLTAAAALIAAAGGIDPLRQSLRAHADYHLGHLSDASLGFASSGLARGLGSPAAAALWVVLAATGFTVLLRSRHAKRARVLVLAALGPLVILVYGLSSPAHARYAVPLLALSCGAVVVAVAVLGRRLAVAAVAAAVLLSAWSITPQLAAYRSAVSPPLAAVDEALRLAEAKGWVLVADRTLVAFLDYAERTRGATVPVLYDHLVETGATPPPPPEFAIAVFDAGHEQLLRGETRRTTFSCSIPAVRRLAQDRFLDIAMITGPHLAGPGRRAGPFILMDGEG